MDDQLCSDALTLTLYSLTVACFVGSFLSPDCTTGTVLDIYSTMEVIWFDASNFLKDYVGIVVNTYNMIEIPLTLFKQKKV